MEYITGIFIAYVFVVIIMPHLAKNKPQFTMGVWAVVLLLLLHALYYLFGFWLMGVTHALAVIIGFVQIVTFLVLVMATGGFSITQMGADLKNSFEVMRRGESSATLVIPLSEQDKQTIAAQQMAAEQTHGSVPPPPQNIP